MAAAPRFRGLLLVLLLGTGLAWRGESLRLADERRSALLVAHEEAPQSLVPVKVPSSFAVVRANASSTAVDPIFLVTTVALSTLANIANVVLHSVRLRGLRVTRNELLSIQENIFRERADSCFSIRSLEVQSDLLTRATQAFTRFSVEQLASTDLSPIALADGKVVTTEVHDEALQMAVRNHTDQLVRSIQEVNGQLRQAMASAVQFACHSAASGEILLQSNVDQLQDRIYEAQGELMEAGMYLVTDFASGVLSGAGNALESLAGLSKDLLKVKTDGKSALKGLEGLVHLSRSVLPDGMSLRLRDMIVSGLRTIWTGAMAVAAYTGFAAAVSVLGNLNDLIKYVTDLIMKPGGALDTTITVISLISTALKLVENILTLAGVKDMPGIKYITMTLSTVRAYLRLARTAMVLHRERGERARMVLNAQLAEMEALLMRSHGTCNALGTAWALSGTSENLVEQVAAEVAALPGGGLDPSSDEVLADTYGLFVQERPALARQILREALSTGTPGVSLRLVKEAEALARCSPITDFAVTKSREQEKALRAIGFEFVPSSQYRHARFLVCRGCGDSVVVGMAVVDDATFQAMERDFARDPPMFQGLTLPSKGSTLNFVQLPRAEGFVMLAFAKVPMQSLETHMLPVLYELREELFMIEGNRVSAKEAEDFQRRAAEFMRQRGSATILSWRPRRVTQSFRDRMYNAWFFQHAGRQHLWRMELGLMDVLAGHFMPAKVVEAPVALKSLIPEHTFTELTHLTVTRGCGCSMGALGNRYIPGGRNILLFTSLADNDRQQQDSRCDWRFDFWLSDGPLLEGIISSNRGKGRGLECATSINSQRLAQPVVELERLLFIEGVRRTPREGGPHWFDRGARLTANDTLLIDSTNIPAGPAGPLVVVEEAGSALTNYLFRIYHRPAPLVPQAPARDSPVGLQPLVRDFRDQVGAVLCSSRCVLADRASVPEAIHTITHRPINASRAQPFFNAWNRGGRCRSQGVQDFQGSTTIASLPALTQRLGPLIIPKGGGSARGNVPSDSIRNVVDPLYRMICDFEVLLVLEPSPCPEDRAPDLRIKDDGSGEVEEFCRLPGNGPPVHRIAVTYDMHHHSDSFRPREGEVKASLIAAGFAPWGHSVLWISPAWNTETFYWRRSLRQRVYVQRDPRTTTATASEVCPAA